jgi:hypothetical protein
LLYCSEITKLLRGWILDGFNQYGVIPSFPAQKPLKMKKVLIWLPISLVGLVDDVLSYYPSAP